MTTELWNALTTGQCDRCDLMVDCLGGDERENVASCIMCYKFFKIEGGYDDYSDPYEQVGKSLRVPTTCRVLAQKYNPGRFICDDCYVKTNKGVEKKP